MDKCKTRRRRGRGGSGSVGGAFQNVQWRVVDRGSPFDIISGDGRLEDFIRRKSNPVPEEGPRLCREKVEGRGEGCGGSSESGRNRVAFGNNKGGARDWPREECQRQ